MNVAGIACARTYALADAASAAVRISRRNIETSSFKLSYVQYSPYARGEPIETAAQVAAFTSSDPTGILGMCRYTRTCAATARSRRCSADMLLRHPSLDTLFSVRTMTNSDAQLGRGCNVRAE